MLKSDHWHIGVASQTFMTSAWAKPELDWTSARVTRI
jgi:hypothetical protein